MRAAAVLAASVTCLFAAKADAFIDADYLLNAVHIEGTEFNTGSGQPAAGENFCGGGFRAISGGAFWDGPAVAPADADEFFTSSLAPFGKRHHYGAGGNVSGGSVGHTRYVQCLRRGKMRGTRTGVKDIPVANLEHGGGHARCPQGTRLFGGGAFWHDGGGEPDFMLANDAWLSSSYPDEDGRLWYADGENRTGEDSVLRVVVRCLPTARLSNVKFRRTNHSLEDGDVGGGARACPAGTAAMTGGAYRHRPGEPPDPNDGADFWLSSLFHNDPTTFPSDAYYADGYNFSGDDEPWVLTVVAYCLT